MKIFNNTVLLIALLSTGFMDAARTTGAPTQQTPVVKPKQTPKQPTARPTARGKSRTPQPRTPQQPAPQQQPNPYIQAVTTIKTSMPSDMVLKNNSFTQEFLNFIKSLDLSDIENTALLQAGVNIHAVWTGDNEQDKKIALTLKNNIESATQTLKSMPQIPKQSTPITPQMKLQPQTPFTGQQQLITSPNCIVNSAMIILDPHRSEKPENAMSGFKAMASNALRVLQEKTVPVIVTSNLLEIILTLKQRVGDSNLQQLKNIIQTTANPNALNALDQQLRNAINTRVHSNILPFISLMDFDTQNVNCYLHKSADLVLVIPKQYIRTNLPNAEKLSLDDQARACGFNPTVVTALTDLTTDNLLKLLRNQQSSQISEDLFVTSLTSMFIPQKHNGQLIAPEQDIKWAFYVVGHGSPAHQTIGKIRDQLKIHKQNLAVLQSGKAMRGKGNLPDRAATQATIAKYEKILEGRSDWPNSQLIPETAQIAGLKSSAFSRLITFFEKNLDVAYLHYVTCFAGGYNQSFVNQILSSLDVNFIVSSEGIHEGVTMSIFVGLIPNSSRTRLVPQTQPYTDFFKLLRLFICQPEEFVKIKGGKKEPVAQLLKTIVPNMILDNQPFVRFPGAGVFAGLSLGKATKSSNTTILTQTIVKAHEIEKKPIDIGSDISVLIINPSRINVPLNLGKNGHCAIVSPSPEDLSPTYEAIHIFKEIHNEQTLQSLLYNFIYLNARLHKQTFIINKLTGSLYLPSGLPYAKDNVINNFIIQIKGVTGAGHSTNKPSAQTTPITAQDLRYGEVGTNVQAVFEFNGTMYQCTIGVKDFSGDDLRSKIEQVTFTPTTDMSTIANKFLTPQEVTKITKPISLNSLAQFINSKIDQQEPFLPEQSDEANKTLLEFTKRKQK